MKMDEKKYRLIRTDTGHWTRVKLPDDNVTGSNMGALARVKFSDDGTYIPPDKVEIISMAAMRLLHRDREWMGWYVSVDDDDLAKLLAGKETKCKIFRLLDKNRTETARETISFILQKIGE